MHSEVAVHSTLYTVNVGGGGGGAGGTDHFAEDICHTAHCTGCGKSSVRFTFGLVARDLIDCQ